MDFGTIKKIESRKNRDGDRIVRMATVEITPYDEVLVELDAVSGTDEIPRIGSRVYFERVTESYLVATRIQDVDAKIDEDLQSGEKLLFAVDGEGARVSRVRLESGGTIRLDEGEERAMLGDTFLKIYNSLQLPTVWGTTGTPLRPLTIQDLSDKVRLK